MEWRTDKPAKAGTYLVTTKYAMMVDAHSGPHSYVRDVELDFFDGEDWKYNVVAWMELPFELPEPYEGE